MLLNAIYTFIFQIHLRGLHFKLLYFLIASAAAAAKSPPAAKSPVMSDSVRPHRRQPTRLLCPWDSPGKNTGVGCHFLLHCMKVKSESEVAQSCPTLRDPMDCSPPGSPIHGIFQARVLEWVVISFSIFLALHYRLFLTPFIYKGTNYTC